MKKIYFWGNLFCVFISALTYAQDASFGLTPLREQVSGTNYYIMVPDDASIYLPSYNSLPQGSSNYFVTIKVQSFDSGTYFLRIVSEPGFPWECYFGNNNNESSEISISQGSSHNFQLRIKNPSNTNVPIDKLKIELRKKNLVIGSTLVQTRNFNLYTDASPPISGITPKLPASIDYENFTVNWSANDSGPANVWKYDVQFKVNNGSWQNWYLGTVQSSANFTGTRGNTYYFHVRSYDNVGNLEPYPQGIGDTYTYIKDYGSVTATLSPTSAISAGAQWNIDGGLWTDSGDRVNNILEGEHTINYKTISGFIAPPSKTVAISPNELRTTSGPYSPITGTTSLSVSPSNQNVPSISGSTTFSVSTNASSYSVSESATWLGWSKSGNTINVSYNANTTTSSRTATITVTAGGQTEQVTVTQSGTTSLSVSPSNQNVPSSSGSTTFSVSTNASSYSVSESATWLSWSKSGTTINVNYNTNSSTISRTATLTVTAEGQTEQVTVTQAPASTNLSVTPSNQNVPSGSGSTTFSVFTNASIYSVSRNIFNATWLDYSINDTTINVSYDANTSTSSRTATLTVRAGGETEQVTVTQSGTTSLSVSPSNQNVPSISGSTTFSVSTNASSYYVSESATWLSWSKSGNTINVSYDANTSTSSRTSTLTVTAGGETEQITVTQSGTTSLSVSPSNQNVPSSSGSTTFSVSTNASSYSVSESATWLSWSKSGTTINVNYNTNSSASSRTATLTVTAEGQTEQVTVTQAPASATLSVTPSNQNVPSSSGSTTFSVSTNASSYSVSESATWLSWSKSGTTINVNYNTNSSASSRTATLTVTAEGQTEQVTVTQAPVSVTLLVSPSIQNVPSSSGSTTFSVSTNASSYSVSESATWLSWSKSGTTINVNYNTNSSTSSRTATITVTAEGQAEQVTVTQAPASVNLSVTPSNQNVPSSSGSTTFSVSTNASSYSVSESATWLSWSKSGTTINVNYNTNSSTSSRTATLTVTAEGETEQVTVTQAPVSVTLLVSPSIQNVPSSSGSTTFSVSTNASSYSVSESATWLSWSKSGTTIYINYNTNSSTSSRTATLTVTAGGETEQVTVTQAENEEDSQVFGSLRVDLFPGSALDSGAQWNVDGGPWRDSGFTFSNISVGTHTLNFKSISGWEAPSSKNITINNGQIRLSQGLYLVSELTSSVKLNLDAAVRSEGAQWKLDDRPWRNSGYIETNVSTGAHTIYATSIPGWRPLKESSTITLTQNQQYVGYMPYFSYSEEFGSLKVDLSPSSAVNTGAQWNVDAGSWRDSGTTAPNLTVGSHTIDFKIISGFATPSAKTVTISADQTTTTSGIYTLQVGSLWIDLSPSSAVNAGAQWRVDGGSWRDSRTTAPNLTVGSHTIDYKAISGYEAPASKTVTISANQTTYTNSVYSEQSGSLSVSLSPSVAVNAGAQWRVDGGSWRDSGTTAPNLTVGSHTIDFKAISGFATPSSKTVTIDANQTTSTSDVYSEQSGSLTVSLSPSAAVSAGGQWNVDGGPWRDSGTTATNLTVGSHTIDFKAISGFATPSAKTVTINANQLTINSGSYNENIPIDSDSDGVPDTVDECPGTTSGVSVNGDGCSPGQLDDDNDTVNNDIDLCPNSNPGVEVNENGCEIQALIFGDVYLAELGYIDACFYADFFSGGGSDILEKGFLYGPTPTVENSISGGSGIDSYILCISELAPDTVYFYRAYATNASGTIYSAISLFRTPGDTNFPPSVSDALFTLDENSGSGTQVGSITATDPDGDPLSFSIVSGNESTAFQIDGSSGLLTVADSRPLDYESTPVFNLVIRASDGTFWADSMVTINLNDLQENIPIDSDSDGVPDTVDQCPGTTSGVSVNGDGCSPGQLDDDNDTVNNDIDLCPNSNPGVEVNENGCEIQALIFGDVYLAELGYIDTCFYADFFSGGGSDILEKGFLYGPTSAVENSISGGSGIDSYILCISELAPDTVYFYRAYATNASGTIYSAFSLFRTPGDTNFPPSVSDALFTLDENSGSGTQVGSITATDPDGDPLSFSIVSGNESTAFQIDGSSGLLTVADSRPLDYESTPVFNLVIRASDGTFWADSMVTINLNDLQENIPIDSDSDGVPDTVDQCPNTPSGESVDNLGCSASQINNGLYTLIPDPQFESVLIDLLIDTDGVINGRVRTYDISSIQDLTLSGNGITDLTGIEDFGSLINLDAYNNQISNVDISNNTTLQIVDLGLNQLTGIDISNNLNIQLLYVDSNILNALDVSNNLLLDQLYANDNPLSCIQVSVYQQNNSTSGWFKDESAKYSINCEQSSALDSGSFRGTGLGQDILSNQTIYSFVTFNQDLELNEIEVFLEIEHTWVNDLQIELTSPTGTTVVLLANQCGNGQNLRATFSDGGNPISCSNLPAISGTVIPQDALASFAGESILGQWTLQINDNFDIDEGIFMDFSLNITTVGELDKADIDEDGISNVTDQCMNTPIGAQVDNDGCPSLADDSDNDGIPNDVDQCPNTNPGQSVDPNGCELFSFNAFKIYTESTACPGIANGQVEISASAETNGYVFDVQLTGNGIDSSFENALSFSSPLSITTLSSGTYSITVTLDDGYEIVFEQVTIAESEDLSAGKTRVDEKGKTAYYKVSGNRSYTVTVNGNIFYYTVDSREESSIAIPVEKGENMISIKGAQCQTVFNELLFLNDVVIYPNPVKIGFYLNGSFVGTVHLFNASGYLVKTITAIEGNRNYINIQEFPPGVYFVKFEDNKFEPIKIIKE